MANFAIKDAMDLKITKIGESTPAVTVDFLNGCSFERSTENVFAKKKGKKFALPERVETVLFYALLLVGGAVVCAVYALPPILCAT